MYVDLGWAYFAIEDDDEDQNKFVIKMSCNKCIGMYGLVFI